MSMELALVGLWLLLVIFSLTLLRDTKLRHAWVESRRLLMGDAATEQRLKTSNRMHIFSIGYFTWCAGMLIVYVIRAYLVSGN